MIFKMFCDPLDTQHIYLHLDIVPTYNFTATETTFFIYSFHIYIYKLFLYITFTEDIFSILYFQMRQFENKFQEHSYKHLWILVWLYMGIYLNVSFFFISNKDRSEMKRKLRAKYYQVWFMLVNRKNVYRQTFKSNQSAILSLLVE